MTIISNKWIYFNDSTEKFFFIFFSGEKWLSWLAEHGRTVNTIRSYNHALRRLIPIIGHLKGNVKLSQLTEADVFAIKEVMSDVNERTVRYYLSVLGLWTEYETGTNIVRRAKLLWNHTEPKRTFLTLSEFEMIYNSAESDRDRLILLLASQMGLRRSEIIGLRLSDIRNGEIVIHGKGHNDGKAVVRSIPNKIVNLMNAYIDGERKEIIRQRGDDSNGFILMKTRIIKTNSGQMDVNTIDNMIRHLSQKTGIKCSMHTFRRLYCTTLANECGLRNDLDTLRRMMRHEDIQTTIRCYLDANEQAMGQAQVKLDAILDRL